MTSNRLKKGFSTNDIENAAILLRQALSSAELDNLISEKELLQRTEQLQKIEQSLIEAINKP